MTIREAAERHGIEPRTLRRWIRAGDLLAERIGHRYLVEDRDVRRAMALRGRRGPSSHVWLTRRIDWHGRIASPRHALMGLGDASETWHDAIDLPGYLDIMATSSRFARPINPLWELTSRLLRDVAEAASAVESTVDRILDAVARAEAYFRPSLAGIAVKPEPEFGNHASHPAVADAYMEFVNLVSWVRALDDRLEHKYGNARYGLIPALAPGSLADRAQRCREVFRTSVAEDASHLANFALHHSMIPYPMNSSARIVGNRLELRVPDRTLRPIRTHRDLSYTEGRTLDAFASATLQAVDGLMACLLDAFEEELPARVRRA